MSHSHVDNHGVFLDQRLDDIFNQKENGFFIELGANDGLYQSNTVFFEKERGWHGILVEPSKKGYDLCIHNRPGSVCLNYACVADDYPYDYVNGDFQDNNPQGSVDGTQLNSTDLCSVPAITLEKILDNYATGPIDLLSLDAEGYELNILKGLNLTKYRPHYILVDLYKKDNEIMSYLEERGYRLYSNVTDYSYEGNPSWDGTNNDFLFFDSYRT